MGVKKSETLRAGVRKVAVMSILAVMLIGCEAPSSTVKITPETVFLSASNVTTVSFTVTGGNGNYVWSMSNGSVSNATMGTLSTANGAAIYQNTRGVVGINVITVSDTASNSANSTITQQ